MERYRSGHNEAVLKTVCPQGRVGSNPTLSVYFFDFFSKGVKEIICYDNEQKYPSWPKGHPWKGCRSLIAARGFKSLLLRLMNVKINLKNLLTSPNVYDNIIKLTATSSHEP